MTLDYMYRNCLELINKNIMKTASRVQVTKPIYKGSSDDWRNYEEFLLPSFDLLK